MDPGNAREALPRPRSTSMQGADALVVKPALGYLDVVRAVRERFPELPLAAYNVSGEYAMAKAAAANEWLDERAVALEILTGSAVPGADLVVTYHAKDAARWLQGASRARVDDRPEEASGEIDVMEHGRTADGEPTSLDRRLFMQLQAFGGARDTAALVLRSRPRASSGLSTRTPTTRPASPCSR